MKFRHLVQLLIRKRGFAINNVRFPAKIWLQEIRPTLLSEITCVLDVGANVGQYAKELRSEGYHGRIVSFEPLSTPYSKLSSAFAEDPNHIAVNYGIGAEDLHLEMRVTGDSVSSSLFDPTSFMLSQYGGAQSVHREFVPIKKLDTIWDNYIHQNDMVYAKIDTQGGESDVIRGAVKSLRRIKYIEVELSLVPLYQNQELLPDVFIALAAAGFSCIGLENEFMDSKTMRMYQVNGLFLNESVEL